MKVSRGPNNPSNIYTENFLSQNNDIHSTAANLYEDTSVSFPFLHNSFYLGLRKSVNKNLPQQQYP